MQPDNWKLTSDFHVTCKFLGRDEEIADSSDIYREFDEDMKMSVSIVGLVVVPDKIVTAICFPN